MIFFFLFSLRLVSRITNGYIFVWSVLHPGGVYDQRCALAHK